MSVTKHHMVVLPLLLAVALVPSTQASGIENTDCPTGSISIRCRKAEGGVPVGYDNPPVHQPTRCESLPEVPDLDPAGNPIPVLLPDGTAAIKTKRYSELVTEPMDVFMDSTPTGAPPPKIDDVSGQYSVAWDPSQYSGASKTNTLWWKTMADLTSGNATIDHQTSFHKYRLYGSYCRVPGMTDISSNTARTGWVKVVSTQNMTEDLMVEVSALLTNVTMTWPTVSPKHGWQMVKVPLEIRGNVPAALNRTMHASNLTKPEGLTVTITATPSAVAFVSGDGDSPVVCPAAAMTWDVPDPEHPTACSYTYQHSSVQRRGQPFRTQTITVWDVVTPDPTLNRPWWLPGTSKDLLVAETQALVTG